MTVERIRRLRTGVTTEDSFGTPPAARGSMMNIAGASDDDLEPGEELLTDEGDDTTMKGPVYDEGRTVRITVRELRELLAAALR